MMPFMPIMSLSDAESQQCAVIADKQSAENRRVRGDEAGGTVSAEGEHGGGIALGVQRSARDDGGADQIGACRIAGVRIDDVMVGDVVRGEPALVDAAGDDGNVGELQRGD